MGGGAHRERDAVASPEPAMGFSVGRLPPPGSVSLRGCHPGNLVTEFVRLRGSTSARRGARRPGSLSLVDVRGLSGTLLPASGESESPLGLPDLRSLEPGVSSHQHSLVRRLACAHLSVIPESWCLTGGVD